MLVRKFRTHAKAGRIEQQKEKLKMLKNRLNKFDKNSSPYRMNLRAINNIEDFFIRYENTINRQFSAAMSKFRKMTLQETNSIYADFKAIVDNNSPNYRVYATRQDLKYIYFNKESFK
ncbi:g006 [Yersinia phage phiR1-37]|uniref:hypothetical protein n=1 Tax=Yersinia phage phiR1-37 TaxID=331278 RepID=UPI00022DBCB2|nr:hypothetical protein phiR1-37_gp006 [Yersinia phage phiR1-37]CCE26030.1 g006 [Yersinia phage phiR1-37]